MLKKLNRFFFFRSEEIGLDNYLVLIMCFLGSVISFIGITLNILIIQDWILVLFALFSFILFISLYLYSRITYKFIISKYVLIIISLIILNFQWLINYGTTGPVIYLFVILESFIIFLFKKTEKIIFTLIIFLNINFLFIIEYNYPDIIDSYENKTIHLIDMYAGVLIYFILSVFLLSVALKFFIQQKEKAEESDRLKSAFLANMSHEIRTPMNGILGFANLLNNKDLSGDQQAKYIKIIERSGLRMLNIINNIVDISKIEASQMKVSLSSTNINKQIEYIYTFFKPETTKKGLNLFYYCDLEKEKSIISTDREKLYAILINLVKNAIKYTKKGDINFGYKIRNKNKKQEIEFYVKDTGIGIPKNRQDAIFERFIQADIEDKNALEGAGLGLTITKAYVEMLGGKIWTISRVNEGSEFYFTIPFYKQ